jgi:hypothetical protein
MAHARALTHIPRPPWHPPQLTCRQPPTTTRNACIWSKAPTAADHKGADSRGPANRDKHCNAFCVDRNGRSTPTRNDTGSSIVVVGAALPAKSVAQQCSKAPSLSLVDHSGPAQSECLVRQQHTAAQDDLEERRIIVMIMGCGSWLLRLSFVAVSCVDDAVRAPAVVKFHCPDGEKTPTATVLRSCCHRHSFDNAHDAVALLQLYYLTHTARAFLPHPQRRERNANDDPSLSDDCSAWATVKRTFSYCLFHEVVLLVP